MTDAAAQAKRLFDGEKWCDAALALYRVYNGETGDDEGNKQLAQYHLAIALYRLKFYQARVRRSSARSPTSRTTSSSTRRCSGSRSSRPTCPSRPTSSSASASTTTSRSRKFNNPNQRDLYWQLNYLLGRYKYRNRQYDEALALFGKVDRAVEVLRPGAVLRRHLERAAPQERAGGAVVPAHRRRDRRGRRGRRGRGAHARPRVPLDGAHVLLGERSGSTRTTRRRSTQTALGGGEVLEQGRRRERVLARRASSRSAGRTSWPATTATRSATSTRSRRRTSRTSYYPEADVLKAVIYFANCQYDDATDDRRASSSRSTSRSTTRSNEVLDAIQGRRTRKRPFYKFLKEVRDGKANLDPTIKPDRRRTRSPTASSSATSSTCASLDKEDGRFKKAPEQLPGLDARRRREGRRSTLARDIAVRNAGAARQGPLPAKPRRAERAPARQRRRSSSTSRPPSETSSTRPSQGGQVTAEESKANIVKPDEEHVIWPFNGEYWRDELGFYRQTITSKCGR